MIDHKYTVHPDNTYEHYYKLCREKYFIDHPEHAKLNNNLNNLNIDPNNLFAFDKLKECIFNLGDEYKSLISEIALFCKTNLTTYGRDTICTKHLDGRELSNISPSFNNMFDKLLSMFMPTIDREFAGSYCRPWYISASRSILRSELPPDNGTTWQWHSDMVPQAAFKLFFYLTDVDENSAPFTYLIDTEGQPVYRAGDNWIYIARNGDEHNVLNPPRVQQSRIPIAEIDELKSKGYKEQEVHLPAGSFMVFSQNYFHKATIPKKHTRDVLQVQLRPVLKKPESYWFGSNAQTHANENHSFDWWAYD